MVQRALLWGLPLILLAAADTVAQQQGSTLPSPTGPREKDRPRLRLELLGQISLPGPVAAGPPRVVDGKIAVPVEGGLALVDPAGEFEAGATSVVQPIDPAGEPSFGPELYEWAVGPAGKFRARTDVNGWVFAEKRCNRCKRGWKKKWKLRVAGDRLALPLVTERFVYFGALDNRVYGLRRRNGHRWWDVSVEGRVTRGPVAWSGTLEVEDEETGEARDVDVDVVLVIPEPGTELIALDGRTGINVARYGLARDGGSIHGVPLTLDDGTIVLIQVGYDPSQVGLQLLQLTAAPERTETPPEPEGPPAPSTKQDK